MLRRSLPEPPTPFGHFVVSDTPYILICHAVLERDNVCRSKQRGAPTGRSVHDRDGGIARQFVG